MILWRKPQYDEEGMLRPDEEQWLSAVTSLDTEAVLAIRKQAGSRANWLLQQWAGRQKAKQKLPGWATQPEYLYGSPLAMEQCSSGRTAEYKAKLAEGNRCIDLSGGMGVDSMALAPKFSELIYVEPDQALASVAAHNFFISGMHHIRLAAGITAEQFLAESDVTADLIYLDPSRRNTSGNKVVALAAMQPDILALLPSLLLRTKRILLKTSPLLDISQAIRQLKLVTHVHVLAVDQECRELLFEIGPHQPDDLHISCWHSHGARESLFSFSLAEEAAAQLTCGPPQTFLYEPDAAILKAGAFKTLALRYGLRKLHPHTHLYTSDQPRNDFPGRIFRIRHEVKVKMDALRVVCPSMRAHLTLRNFPGTAKALRQQLQLKDGGDIYLFAITNYQAQKVLLVTEKMARKQDDTEFV